VVKKVFQNGGIFMVNKNLSIDLKKSAIEIKKVAVDLKESILDLNDIFQGLDTDEVDFLEAVNDLKQIATRMEELLNGMTKTKVISFEETWLNLKK
jgi:hypothetical protein